MPNPRLDTSELHRFAAELDRAPAETIARVRGSLTRHANQIAKTARAEAPKDRPWLSTADGIAVASDQERLTRRIVSGPDPRGKPVGLFVEFGTSQMPPRPFMLPALERHGPEFVDDVGRILDRVHYR